MSGISTKHVVLGLLAERPSYGYELAQRLSSRLGFLALRANSIYRVLDRLEDDGWIVEVGQRRVGRTRRGAARVMYGPTTVGIEQLRAWFAQPCDRADIREELHAKLIVASPADLPELLAIVEEQAGECLRDLAAMRRPVLADASRPDVPWSNASAMLVDDFAARWLQCLADWLDNVSVILEERIEQAASLGRDDR